jgi:DNA-binding transcriptional LysR family regulator
VDLSSLEIFEAVAEHSSVTKAATVLGRVPSSVTSRVQQLEADLGVLLFSREAKKMTLTAEGEIFREYAKRLRTLEAETRHAVRARRPSGTLKLGTMESTAVSRLPDILSRYRTLFPEVFLHLDMGATQDLATDVLSGKLDCALLARPTTALDPSKLIVIPELEALNVERVFIEDLVIVLPPQHAQIRGPDDLQVSSLAALEVGCTYRRLAEAWGGGSLSTIEVSSYHSILASVAAGASIGVMPRSVYDRLQWPIEPVTFSLGWVDTVLVWRKSEQSPQLDALRGLLSANNASVAAGRNARH